MNNRSIYVFLRISFGLIYLWFGALKFFNELSPAETLASSTIEELTFGLIPAKVNIILLASWEVLVGLLLLGKFFYRFGLALALVHMVFTFSPFILMPELVFDKPPVGFSLVGQYIVKNLVFIGALLLLWKNDQSN